MNILHQRKYVKKSEIKIKSQKTRAKMTKNRTYKILVPKILILMKRR
jgi:hypothetical protein